MMFPKIDKENTSATVLVVGNKAHAGLNGQFSKGFDITECGSLIEAIEIGSRRQFQAVLIIPDHFGAPLKSGIRNLRKVLPEARIIILVRTYEEPFAVDLMHPDTGVSLITDYVVAPATVSQIRVVLFKGTAREAAVKAEPTEIFDAEMIEHLSKLATEDELTGLKNRRYVREFVRQIIERAESENIRMTLFVFDIDNFKHYNDVYGHGAGDEILKQAAIMMRRSCRKHDVVARVGGDEFAVVFWDNPHEGEHDQRRRAQAQHPKEVLVLTERFRRELKATELDAIGPEGKGVLTISGGLAGFPRDGASVEELFEQADKGLYEAKRSGKNAVYLVGEPESSS